MTAEAAKRDEVFQACYIVDDIHKAMQHWHEATQVGPFFYADSVELEIDHRGVTKPLTIGLALAQTTTLQLELVSIKETTGSAYADALGLGGTGFHHLGSYAWDYDATLERYRTQGHEIAHSGIGVGGCRYCYVDTRATLGTMTEVIEPVPDLLAVFATITGAARDWDGADPYRAL
jgi:hypothetical protein